MASLMIARPTLLLLVLAAAVSAHGELQLKGIMMSDGESLFSVYSTEDQSSKWVRIGESFAEFKAVAFDSSSETLTIERGTERVQLRLVASRIPDLEERDETGRTIVKVEVARDGGVIMGGRSYSMDEFRYQATLVPRSAVVHLATGAGATVNNLSKVVDYLRVGGVMAIRILPQQNGLPSEPNPLSSKWRFTPGTPKGE